MNKKINIALAYRRLTGDKFTLAEFGTAVFPDVDPGLAHTRAENITLNRKTTFTDDEITRIAEFTGVPLDYLTGKLNMVINFI